MVPIVFRGKHIVMVRMLLSGGCVTNLIFLELCENATMYAKVKIRRSEFPTLPKFPVESDFPRNLKLQKIEHEIKVITNFEITKCNTLFQIFVQKG